jgi:glutathione S-transferase
VDRCRAQLDGTLSLLERERAAQASLWWGGDRMGHADIATACVLRFVSEAHPGIMDRATTPALAALSDRCEAMEAFRTIRQPFNPPA